MDVEGAEAAAAPPPMARGAARTPRSAARTPAAAARRRSAAATPAAAAAATPATPSTGGGAGGGTPVVVPGDLTGAVAALPADVSSMSVAALKAWVTQWRLEDEAFMALAGNGRAKKADWVSYVKGRAGLA
jgi:hypothetical protein